MFDAVVPGSMKSIELPRYSLYLATSLGTDGRPEVVERHEDLHAEGVSDQIIEQKEPHEASDSSFPRLSTSASGDRSPHSRVKPCQCGVWVSLNPAAGADAPAT